MKDCPKPIQCLLVGLGQIGMMYDFHTDKEIHTHAKAISLDCRFRLVGAFDPSPTQCSLFKDRYGREAYTDISQLQNLPAIDLVILACPTSLHLSMIRELVTRLRPLSILCEKPFGYKYEESKVLCKELKDKYGIEVYVNYTRRCDPSSREIRKIIATSARDWKVKGTCFYTKGAFNNASHFIDLLSHWMGPCRSADMLDCRPQSVLKEDIDADFVVRFDNAEVVFQCGDESRYWHYGVTLYLSHGRLSYDFGGDLISFNRAQADECPGLEKGRFIIKNQLSTYQKNVYNELYKAMMGKEHVLCSGLEAVETLRLLSNLIQPR